jgi:hypothetical protein
MSSDFDPADFVDDDFQTRKTSPSGSTSTLSPGSRMPTREELEARYAETQQKLTELTRKKEEYEREKVALEESRRRQMEFHTGRQEMVQHLTRGVGLLEEAEFTARRDAEQMAKVLADFRGALAKLESIHEESWNQDNVNVELTRALTAIENARMEWNTARLKFPVLSGQKEAAGESEPAAAPAALPLAGHGFGELCKLGLAMTWPLVLVALGALGVLITILIRQR